MKTKKVYTDKVYRLKRDAAPLTYMLASHHTRRSPLLHFDEETGENKQLRYARNQKSPFVDEQDGNAILEPIIFEDGLLRVPKNNQVLQEFLYYHTPKECSQVPDSLHIPLLGDTNSHHFQSREQHSRSPNLPSRCNLALVNFSTVNTIHEIGASGEISVHLSNWHIFLLLSREILANGVT